MVETVSGDGIEQSQNSELERMQQLVEEHDISFRAPVVAAWREAESEEEFVHRAKRLDESATVQVDVPDAVVEAAEARADLFGDDRREQRIEEAITDIIEFDLRY